MKKFDKIYKKWIVSEQNDAAMPELAEGDQSQMEAGQARPQAAPGQTQEAPPDKLAPAAEVMLIRDMLRALVVTIPSDNEVMKLVQTELPNTTKASQAQQVHEQVNNIIDKYADYKNNAERLQLIDEALINENNRRYFLKKIQEKINKYTK